MIYSDIKNAVKKIAPIFQEMEWTWTDSYVPDNKQIEDAFRDKLKYLLDNKKASSVSSGRIYAERVRDSEAIVFGLERKSADEWSDHMEYKNDLQRHCHECTDRDNNQARDNERAIPKSKDISVSIGGKDTSENNSGEPEKVD